MSNCSSCSSKDSCNGSSCEAPKTTCKYGNIKNIIGVISGKGGVGKSTVSGILAVKLRKEGYKVGVLDGDITGPSMPRFFGINEKRAEMESINEGEQVKFIPVVTPLGIKVMSLNLLTQNEDDPVIWRGPVITGVLNQMYTDTVWEDLDYLIIDMPPGTGDIALTVMQSFPISGLIVVSTPQDMVSMIVKKVVTMAKKLGINILGVVENMSYITCGNCSEKIRVFSKKTAEEEAKYLGIPLLMEMPIDIDLAESLQNKEAEKYVEGKSEYNHIVEVLK